MKRTRTSTQSVLPAPERSIAACALEIQTHPQVDGAVQMTRAELAMLVAAARRSTAQPGRSAINSTQTRQHRAAEMKLSIMMPAFNEEATIDRAIERVLTTDYQCGFELIVVNDGSVDNTSRILRRIEHPNLVVIRHLRNLGKGAALQTAGAVATGTHLVPFDADLEYEPSDLIGMIRSVTDGQAEVVYGSRVLGSNPRFQSHRHIAGNRALTMAANAAFDSCLSDIHTCLKLMPVELFRSLGLTENGFGLDTEITAKLLKLGIRPVEVPVSYASRSVAEGKKITWRDGVACLRILHRVRRAPGSPLAASSSTATAPERLGPVRAPLVDYAYEGVLDGAVG